MAIHVLGDFSLHGGTVQITLDGQLTQLIDPHGDARCGQVLFSRTGLANGQHSINLRLTEESLNLGLNVTGTNGLAGSFVFENFMHVSFSSVNWFLIDDTDGRHWLQIYRLRCHRRCHRRG